MYVGADFPTALAEVLVVLYDHDDAGPTAMHHVLSRPPPTRPRRPRAARSGRARHRRPLGEHDLTPFDDRHAGVVATGDGHVLPTEQDYDAVGLERVPLAEEVGG